jgi:hypothetical protein
LPVALLATTIRRLLKRFTTFSCPWVSHPR